MIRKKYKTRKRYFSGKIYSLIVKLNNGNWIKYRRITNLVKTCQFFDNKYNGLTNYKWNFVNVYNKKTKEFLGSYKNGKNPTRPQKANEL